MISYEVYYNDQLNEVDSSVYEYLLSKTNGFTMYSYSNPLAFDFSSYPFDCFTVSHMPITSASHFDFERYKEVCQPLMESADVIRLYTDCKTAESLQEQFQMIQDRVASDCARCVIKMNESVCQRLYERLDKIKSISFIKENQVFGNIFIDQEMITCTHYGNALQQDIVHTHEVEMSAYRIQVNNVKDPSWFAGFLSDMIMLSELRNKADIPFAEGLFGLYFLDRNGFVRFYYDAARKYMYATLTADEIDDVEKRRIDFSSFTHIKSYATDEPTVYNSGVLNIFESPFPDEDLQDWVMDIMDALSENVLF